MSRRKICVVTATRAEYGLLSYLMSAIREAPDFDLQLVVTGMHLSPEFGSTYTVIESDGFIIDEKIEMLLSSDTAAGATKSLSLALSGFADAFERLKPDLIVMCGDRYEMLAVAQAALLARIPVAHLAGGETTEGAFDESIRHSLTKFAHLHFVTNEKAAQRVRQLGENPDHIFNVGYPGVEHIANLKQLNRSELEEKLQFKLLKRNLLVSFHPVTLSSESSVDQLRSLLKALELPGNSTGIIITKPNADPEGRRLIKVLEEFSGSRDHVCLHSNLGQHLYLNTIRHVDAVVGNSSSGLYEVPSLHKPTVNIGDRQKGRLRASSVIDCSTDPEDIRRAIDNAFDADCSSTVNPYGRGEVSQKIMAVLRETKDYRQLLIKHFYDI